MADLVQAYTAVRSALQAAPAALNIAVTGSGFGLGSGDIWFRIGETEFYVEVKRMAQRMSRA